ncbi:DegT/DnrJ/EryC1/StrS aminotransferase family protein [candidate division WWE3 bacterium]|uniref:DegT/DnrJ/EryC1/StrS aminotransferase family protein n=1 Tax=candidate division WWE3 bacterium TaxID=2053526 RepID=A0A955LLN1_UNCKA|nr:DegT/DnrJ/EryC1/StrS aminotransferase family protein [candidate division WWE3 bacterium]
MLISIGFSPNLTREDAVKAAKMLFSQHAWYNKNGVEDLLENLARTFDVDVNNIFPSISGRSATYDALKLFGVGEGDDVVMQAFNCVAVVNSILWTRATPVYADIKKETLNLDLDELKRKVTAKTKAIIVQHTFGLPFDQMDDLMKFAKERGIYVIEDCAHALGAKVNDRYVGTIADAGIFSFGRDKVVSSVFGGALYINSAHPDIVQKAQELYAQKQPVGRGWILKQLLHPVLSYISLQTYSFLSLGKLLHAGFQVLGLLSKATDEAEKSCGPMPNWIDKKYPGALATLASFQLKALVDSNTRRGEIAKMYASAGIVSVQQGVDNQDRIWLRYSVLAENPRKLINRYKRYGIVVGDWYDQVVGPKEIDLSKTGYKQGATPVAEDVSAHVVNLPCYQRMSDVDVEKVIMVYKQKD